MKSFFSRWGRLRRVMGRPESKLWLFDFDGTLAPIAEHPDRAALPKANRRLLSQLAQRHPGRVGVLSGRPLAQIRRKVGIKNLIYGGTHGFEIRSPSFQWNYPLSASRRRRLARLAGLIRRRLAELDGAWLEDKHWTLCIHYREIKPKEASRMRAIVGDMCNQARTLGFKIQKGLKATEIFSDARWNKGQAVRWLKKRLRAEGVFYAGDDVTDETVFRVLGPHDVGVHIGKARRSRAAYYVSRQEKSPALLERILVS